MEEEVITSAEELAPKPFLPGGTGAGGKAHLQSREPAPLPVCPAAGCKYGC